MVMVIFGPSPVGAVPPIYLSGSFGLVRPAWIIHALGRASKYGGAHPTDLPAQVSARVRPIPFAAHARRAPGGSRCCIIKPPLAVGLGFFGVSVRKRTAPVALILGRVAVLPPPRLRPSSLLRHPLHTHWSHPYALLRRPAPRSSSSTYRIRSPRTLRGPLLLGVSSYPPALNSTPLPLLALSCSLPLLHTLWFPRNSRF